MLRNHFCVLVRPRPVALVGAGGTATFFSRDRSGEAERDLSRALMFWYRASSSESLAIRDLESLASSLSSSYFTADDFDRFLSFLDAFDFVFLDFYLPLRRSGGAFFFLIFDPNILSSFLIFSANRSSSSRVSVFSNFSLTSDQYPVKIELASAYFYSFIFVLALCKTLTTKSLKLAPS